MVHLSSSVSWDLYSRLWARGLQEHLAGRAAADPAWPWAAPSGSGAPCGRTLTVQMRTGRRRRMAECWTQSNTNMSVRKLLMCTWSVSRRSRDAGNEPACYKYSNANSITSVTQDGSIMTPFHSQLNPVFHGHSEQQIFHMSDVPSDQSETAGWCHPTSCPASAAGSPRCAGPGSLCL